MKKKIVTSFIAITTLCFLFSFDSPKGWHKAGSRPDKYNMGTETGAGMNGSNAATIQSNVNKINGFGTLMQSCKADKYAGKRVRMSGYIKSVNVKEWAGFWFRVDKDGSKRSLAFDNMSDRSVKGTTDWKEYNIILDVPEDASMLAYGALLAGTGQIWFSNIKFEVVDPSTTKSSNQRLEQPSNLNFAD